MPRHTFSSTVVVCSPFFLCFVSHLFRERYNCFPNPQVHEPRDEEGNVVDHDPIQLQVNKMDRLLTVADTKPVSG